MAVVSRIRIDPAGSEAHDLLEREVAARLQQSGGPPDGLLVHVAFPEGDALVLVEVFRTEALLRSFLRDVLAPAIERVGLAAGDPEVSQAYSMARP